MARETRRRMRIIESPTISQDIATRSYDCQVAPPFTPGLFLQPFVVSQLLGSVIAEIVEGTGLSGTEFAVVSTIAIWDDPTPTALVRTLGMSPTTLSAIL